MARNTSRHSDDRRDRRRQATPRTAPVGRDQREDLGRPHDRQPRRARTKSSCPRARPSLPEQEPRPGSRDVHSHISMYARQCRTDRESQAQTNHACVSHRRSTFTRVTRHFERRLPTSGRRMDYPLEAALLSFLAAVIVAIITTSANVVLHRRSEQQAEAGWQTDQRFPAYVGLMSAATEFSALITNHENLLTRRSRLRPWEAIVYMRMSRHVDRLHGAWSALVMHLAEIRLLGSPSVVAQAEHLVEVVGTSFQQVTAGANSRGLKGRWTGHGPLVHKSVSRFRDACRLELGQATITPSTETALPG